MSLKLLTEKILPLIFTKDGSSLVSCKFDYDSVGIDQFRSSVIFLTAIVASRVESREIPLVVKLEPFDEDIRSWSRTGSQFYVEVLMYDQLLPLLDRKKIVEECFARFYHGVGCGDDKVVVLEDLRPRGYMLAKERAFVDYDHLAVAMAKLGRFHALSFAAKQESPSEFFDLVTRVKETSWIDDNTLLYSIKTCIHRAVDPLVEKGKNVDVLKAFLERIDANICEFMLELLAPEEPSAVLCHGDFCRNNMLFRYTDGKPTDVKFFDIATARYSSPMVDISFFLLMNSSPQVRHAHWDDFLTVYHHALSTAVPGTKVPSLEDVQKELSKKFLYGFIHCAHFLPVMLFDNIYTTSGAEIASQQSKESLAHDLALIGGEVGTKILSDMVEELMDRGCLTLQHAFLQNR